VKGGGPQRELNPSGNWFAPPGSNQSSSGGNETAEASGAEGRKGDLASVQAVTLVNAEQASKRLMQEPTRPGFVGRPKLVGRYERTSSIRPAGVLATACKQSGPYATREVPSGDRSVDQLATRERKAGPTGMAERLVVPMKLGNSSRGKGPQLKADARSDDRKGDWR
jgi:hypothetical protein